VNTTTTCRTWLGTRVVIRLPRDIPPTKRDHREQDTTIYHQETAIGSAFQCHHIKPNGLANTIVHLPDFRYLLSGILPRTFQLSELPQSSNTDRSNSASFCMAHKMNHLGSSDQGPHCNLAGWGLRLHSFASRPRRRRQPRVRHRAYATVKNANFQFRHDIREGDHRGQDVGTGHSKNQNSKATHFAIRFKL